MLTHDYMSVNAIPNSTVTLSRYVKHYTLRNCGRSRQICWKYFRLSTVVR